MKTMFQLGTHSRTYIYVTNPLKQYQSRFHVNNKNFYVIDDQVMQLLSMYIVYTSISIYYFILLFIRIATLTFILFTIIDSLVAAK